MAGIDNLSKVFDAVVAGVNAQQSLVSVDYGALVNEVLDADESELEALAEKVRALDLNNDALEAQIEAIAAAGAKPVAFVLRLLKLFVVKKP